MTPRHWVPALTLTLAVAITPGAAEVADRTAPATEIEIRTFAFHPAEIRVKVGARVTWVNRDDEPHTVTDESIDLRSPALDTDDRFDFTFAQPGQYRYYCRLHPQMTGNVLVE